MQGELRQHHQLVYHDETVVLRHNTTVRHCERPGILTRGGAPPQGASIHFKGGASSYAFYNMESFQTKIVPFNLLWTPGGLETTDICFKGGVAEKR